MALLIGGEVTGGRDGRCLLPPVAGSEMESSSSWMAEDMTAMTHNAPEESEMSGVLVRYVRDQFYFTSSH